MKSQPVIDKGISSFIMVLSRVFFFTVHFVYVCGKCNFSLHAKFLLNVVSNVLIFFPHQLDFKEITK